MSHEPEQIWLTYPDKRLACYSFGIWIGKSLAKENA